MLLTLERLEMSARLSCSGDARAKLCPKPYEAGKGGCGTPMQLKLARLAWYRRSGRCTWSIAGETNQGRLGIGFSIRKTRHARERDCASEFYFIFCEFWANENELMKTSKPHTTPSLPKQDPRRNSELSA